MRHILALLLALLPLSAPAQQPDSAARRVLSALTESWTVGIDSNSTSVDIATYNRYKSLFQTTATVDDDLDFRFIPGRGAGTYKATGEAKDFDVYAHDAARQVAKIRIDSVGPALSIAGTDSLEYEITRIAYVEKPARFLTPDPDSLAAAILALHPDIRFERGSSRADAQRMQIREFLKAKMTRNADVQYGFAVTSTLRIRLARTGDADVPLRIESIRLMTQDLRCVNDRDNDGVADGDDIAIGEYGEFTADGAPDADLDGVRDEADKCLLTFGSARNEGCPETYFVSNRQLEGALGLQFHSLQLALPELNALGYRNTAGADMVDVLQSRRGTINSPRAVAGVYATGSNSYFFGRNARNLGISAGFSYSRFSADFQLTDTIRYTYKSNDGNNDYRRQITISRLTEKMELNVITVPLLLHYRLKVKGASNMVLSLKAGPSLLYITGRSSHDATIDVGGIYQVDSIRNAITYHDALDPNSSWNVYLTTEGINRQNASPGAAAVFNDLAVAGYDFASNKPYRNQTIVSRLSYALNFSLDGQYRRKTESPLAIRAGVRLIYAPSMGHKDHYVPMERTSDQYNSIFNSNGPSRYFAYALNLGLVYDL